MASSVLIVDDHAGFRATARRLLESEGYAVVGEAEDGAAALAAVAELRPDVVLLDVQLPDIDGFEVSSRLTRANTSAAVIMVSSRDGADYGSLASDSGARGFVAKSDLSGAALEELLP
jgi:two-component system response regulator EvgA